MAPSEITKDTDASRREYILDMNRNDLKAAEADGFAIIRPDDNTLQLDIDSEESYTEFFRNYRLFAALLPEVIDTYTEVPSKSGLPKRHITIKLKQPFNVHQRIALQACLGSDLRREIFNFVRVYFDVPDPILFFRKQD